jgi:hypothetical protein
LLIEVQVDAAGLQRLDRAQQIDERAAQAVDRPGQITSNLCRCASLSIWSRPGRPSRPLAPLIPASLYRSITCQPRRSAIWHKAGDLVLDGLLVGRYADVNCGALLHDSPRLLSSKHQGQKAPLNDNGFLPSFSWGFLYTSETSTLTSWSEDRSRPWASYTAPRPGCGSGAKGASTTRRWLAPSPSSAGAQTCRATGSGNAPGAALAATGARRSSIPVGAAMMLASCRFPSFGRNNCSDTDELRPPNCVAHTPHWRLLLVCRAAAAVKRPLIC